VQSHYGDLLSISCSGVAGADLPLLLAVTTPCVLAGVVAVKVGAAAYHRWGTGPGPNLEAAH
jgi:hypothetical protein